MQPRRFILFTAFVALSTVASESRAFDCVTGTPAVSFSFAADGRSCNMPDTPGVVTLTIQIAGIPVQKVRFTLADPPIGTVIAESWSFPHTGNRQTGIEVDFGGCTDGAITLGQLTIEIAPGEDIACTPWEISGVCEAQDCEGLWRPGQQVPGFHVGGDHPYACYCSEHECMTGYPPYDLYPPDGATNVPLDVVLTWTDDNNWPDPIYMPGPHGCYVYINSRPECVGGGRYDVNCGSFAPDFLEPGRTYYWSPTWWLCCATGCDLGLSGTAPMHSFTTEGTLSATPATWGKVKSLYRD